jgi:hypothetical protein
MVGALSKGLDDAQDTVLEPLTGVGTDLSVSCPLIVPDEQSGGTGAGDPFSQLSDEEQRQLERENESHDAGGRRRLSNVPGRGERGRRGRLDLVVRESCSRAVRAPPR